jgi:c-di-GMP-binding flagellar brake protein YcgR
MEASMVDPGSNDDEWQRIAGNTQVLVRSRIEIAKLLAEVAQRRHEMTANLTEGGTPFTTHLHYLDPFRDYILVERSHDPRDNAGLRAAGKATFHSTHTRGPIQFLVLHPTEVDAKGVPVIRFDFPDSLLLQQRRAHRRIATIPELPLRCVADSRGFISFECKITDIGCGGLGAMVYDDSIHLEAGAVLKGCKITHPNGSEIEVDIEVRHLSKSTLANGAVVRRAGCSFIGSTANIENLGKLFVLNMESPADPGAGNA